VSAAVAAAPEVALDLSLVQVRQDPGAPGGVESATYRHLVVTARQVRNGVHGYLDRMHALLQELADKITAAGFDASPVQIRYTPDGYAAAFQLVGATDPLIEVALVALAGHDHLDQPGNGIEWRISATQEGRAVIVFNLVGGMERHSFVPADDPAALAQRWVQFAALVRDDDEVLTKISRRLAEHAGAPG
jgi:hypothetical protein